MNDQQGRTKMDQKVFGQIRRGLNAHHGASSGGCYVVVDTVSGHVGSHLFTPGSRPSLPAGQILVCVGGYFSFGTLRSVRAIAGVKA